jgi:carboxyl-terminal processing protease
MPRRNLSWLATITCLSLFCWAVAQGSLVPAHGPMQYVKGFPGYQQDYERLSLLVDILQHVEQSYVHELSDEDRRKFMDAAVNAGLNSLDQHSAYINPKEYKQFSRTNDGSFSGVGIQIHVNPQTKRLFVISPIVGTPAYNAGIKPGDEIEKIDGQATQGMTADDAVDKIQGHAGTKITLTIRRRGDEKPFDVTLTRSDIVVETVMGDTRSADKQWEWMIDKENKIGYLRLTQFNKKSTSEMKAALQKLKEQNVRGVVLDLRTNPGGLLDAAVDIADMFLTSGKIVSVEGRTRSPQTYSASPDDGKDPKKLKLANPAMVILVDGFSASASEILAAALQDNHRAEIIGERTYGKGSVQNLIQMESGRSALKLTTAKYLRPSGKNIHRFPDSKEEDEWGVRPDTEVKVSPQEEADYLQARRDRDVVRDPETPAEIARKLAVVALPIGQAWTLNQPLGAPVYYVEVLAAGNLLPRLPRTFSDKVLDKALDHIREKLRGKPVAEGEPVKRG